MLGTYLSGDKLGGGYMRDHGSHKLGAGGGGYMRDHGSRKLGGRIYGRPWVSQGRLRGDDMRDYGSHKLGGGIYERPWVPWVSQARWEDI